MQIKNAKDKIDYAILSEYTQKEYQPDGSLLCLKYVEEGEDAVTLRKGCYGSYTLDVSRKIRRLVKFSASSGTARTATTSRRAKSARICTAGSSTVCLTATSGCAITSRCGWTPWQSRRAGREPRGGEKSRRSGSKQRAKPHRGGGEKMAP